MVLDDNQTNAMAQLKPGSVLVGGVGSGKSAVAISFWYRNFYNYKLIIITTAKKRDGKEWEEEFGKLGIPFLGATVDSWNNILKYADMSDCFFIFDENHLCGHGTWVNTFLKIVRKNKWVMLTATPGDSWIEYCSVFIANGFYKNRSDFLQQHVVWNPYVSYPSIKSYINEQKLMSNRNKVIVIMGANSHAVKRKHIIATFYNTELYLKCAKERWNVFTNSPIKNVTELCYSLRRIVNSAHDRELAFVATIESAKLKRFIVFYNFDYELDILKKIATQEGYTYSEWNGHAHEPIPDTDEWLYFVQYTSGAEGWNCTVTNNILFYSLSYSYKQIVQAEGRIDRRSSNYSVLHYFYLVSDSPIDSAILSCLDKKHDFNERRFAKWNGEQ